MQNETREIVYVVKRDKVENMQCSQTKNIGEKIHYFRK